MEKDPQQTEESSQKSNASENTKNGPLPLEIPTPWGPVKGTVPGFLWLFFGAVLTYLALLYFSLPNRQPRLLVDPVVRTVVEVYPPTPIPRLEVLNVEDHLLSPTRRQYEVLAGDVVYFELTPNNSEKECLWMIDNREVDKVNKFKFEAPEAEEVYVISACEITLQGVGPCYNEAVQVKSRQLSAQGN